MNRLHRRNKRRNLFWTAATVVAICFVAYLLIDTMRKSFMLHTHKQVTSGMVIAAHNRRGGVDYSFYVNNKHYKGQTSYINLSPSFCESLIGRSFPVIYVPSEIGINEMLITASSFENYNMKQPDSLSWIEKWVRK